MDNSERNDLRAIQALARKYDAKVEEIDSGMCYVYRGTGENQIVVEIRYRWSEQKIERILQKYFITEVRENERKGRITAEPKNSKKAMVTKLIAAGEKGYDAVRKVHRFAKEHAGDSRVDPLTGEVVRKGSAKKKAAVSPKKTAPTTKKKTATRKKTPVGKSTSTRKKTISTTKKKTATRKKASARKKTSIVPEFKVPEFKVPNMRF